MPLEACLADKARPPIVIATVQWPARHTRPWARERAQARGSTAAGRRGWWAASTRAAAALRRWPRAWSRRRASRWGRRWGAGVCAWGGRGRGRVQEAGIALGRRWGGNGKGACSSEGLPLLDTQQRTAQLGLPTTQDDHSSSERVTSPPPLSPLSFWPALRAGRPALRAARLPGRAGGRAQRRGRGQHVVRLGCQWLASGACVACQPTWRTEF